MNWKRLSIVWCGVACLALSACMSAKNGGPIDESKYTAPIKLACVGDSITFGSGLQDRRHDSFPSQLAVMLGEKWDVKNCGNSGTTMLKSGDRSYWNQGTYRNFVLSSPDVVVIMLGTNDSKPQNWAHKDEFVNDYISLIDVCHGLESNPKIWICKPVPAFPGFGGITEDVIGGEESAMIDEVAKKTNTPVIDLHAALAGHGDLFPDTVHPNPEGAKLMAQAIYETLTGKKAAKWAQ